MPNRLAIVISPVIAFAIVVFCAAGVVAMVHQSNATESALRQAEVSTNMVMRRQLDQETGLRGYAATANAIFLKPYRQGLSRFPASVAQARAQLLGLANVRAVNALDDEVRIHNAWVRDVAGPLIQNPQRRNALALHVLGKNLVDRFRDDNDRVIAALNRDATRLERRNQFAIAGVIAGGLVLGMIFGMLAYLTERRRSKLQEDSFRHQMLFEQERLIADRLQQAVIDRDLRQVPGADIRGYYQAAGDAERVGGDWYDVFTLADGRLLIIVGDVIGHGLQASIAMRDTRYAILGAALDEKEPGRVISLANRRIMEQFGSQPIATVICALIDPVTRELRYASAGHPPPVVVDGVLATRLYASGDLPLGVAPDTYTTRACKLPADAAIVFYTDGLTEFSRDPIEGERRLLAAAVNIERSSEENPAAALVRDVLRGAAQGDDIAVVSVRLKALPAKPARSAVDNAVA